MSEITKEEKSELKTGNNHYIKNNGYTNLREIYYYKGIVFLFIAWFTVLWANTFEGLLVGALTTIIGIYFDVLIVSRSNYGPRQKIMHKFAKIAQFALFIICALIIVYFVTRNMIVLAEGTKNFLALIVKCAIFSAALVGPITEFCFNKPIDD